MSVILKLLGTSTLARCVSASAIVILSGAVVILCARANALNSEIATLRFDLTAANELRRRAERDADDQKARMNILQRAETVSRAQVDLLAGQLLNLCPMDEIDEPHAPLTPSRPGFLDELNRLDRDAGRLLERHAAPSGR